MAVAPEHGYPISQDNLRFAEWLSTAGMALHTIEIGQGVKFYMDDIKWLGASAEPQYPESPYSLFVDGVWYHSESAYERIGICNFFKTDKKYIWPEWLTMESELSVHGPFTAAEYADCMGLEHPQLFYWDITLQLPNISPDAVFGTRKVSVNGTSDGLGWHEAYVTRDDTWFLQSYKFYICVWMLKGIITPLELKKHIDELIILPAIPPIIVYTHDSYGTYSEATMQALPRGWDGKVSGS